MSLRWRDRRAKLFAGEDRSKRRGATGESSTRRVSAGESSKRQAARRSAPQRRRGRKKLAVVPIFAVAVVALLALAFLRISILRTRYALGETLQHETELRTRERTAAVDVRVIRDPHRLREGAAAQGFVRPERVIDLSERVRGQ
jgi:hypothetical protein